MRKKNKIQIILFVFIGIITLGIGYAAISNINLILSGNSTASVNQENFNVHFVSNNITPTMTNGTATIDNGLKSASFIVTNLSKKEDYAEATYTIINDSQGIDADVSVEFTNSNEEYFEVTKTLSKSTLEPTETATLTVRVTLIKTPITNAVSSAVIIKLKAIPPELNIETVYAFGDPSDPSITTTTDYTTLNKNVFIKQDGNEKSVCIIKNNNLECFKINNVSNEQTHASQVFLNSQAYSNNTTYYDSKFDMLQCAIYNDGKVVCGAREYLCIEYKSSSADTGLCEPPSTSNYYCKIDSNNNALCDGGNDIQEPGFQR